VLQTIANAFKVAEIRKKLAFTAAMLLLYRLGAYIPAPGVDLDTVKEIESNFAGNDILGFLNLFSGGSLSRLSLFALGIMPYITASIILQLLTVVVPSLERLQKEGEVGQQKITQYTSRSRSATCSCSAPSRTRREPASSAPSRSRRCS
jgi:preprotein translocase subunit SecY